MAYVRGRSDNMRRIYTRWRSFTPSVSKKHLSIVEAHSGDSIKRNIDISHSPFSQKQQEAIVSLRPEREGDIARPVGH